MVSDGFRWFQVIPRCSKFGKKVRPVTLLKKRFWYGYFHVYFAKLLRTPFFIEPGVSVKI